MVLKILGCGVPAGLDAPDLRGAASAYGDPPDSATWDFYAFHILI